MPHFSIDTIPLSPMQKKELINGIKKLYSNITGIDPSQVTITLNEVPAENMGISSDKGSFSNSFSDSPYGENPFKKQAKAENPFGEDPFQSNPFGENPFKKQSIFSDTNEADDYSPSFSNFSKKKEDFKPDLESLEDDSFNSFSEEEEVSSIFKKKEKKPKKMISFLKEIFPK